MTETWTTKAGRVVDEHEAERMSAAFEADDTAVAEAVAGPVRRRGRPRLPGTRGHRSPKVEFRVGEELHILLKEQARKEHRRVSDLAREAAEQYLSSHR